MPMLKNEHLAGLSTITAWGEIAFSPEGLAEVSVEAAAALATVEGFSLVDVLGTPAVEPPVVEPPVTVTPSAEPPTEEVMVPVVLVVDAPAESLKGKAGGKK